MLFVYLSVPLKPNIFNDTLLTCLLTLRKKVMLTDLQLKYKMFKDKNEAGIKYNPREKQNGAYFIIHTKTNKKYVGSTNDLYTREIKHRGDLYNQKHYSKGLQEAYNDDSDIGFIYFITETREDAYKIEQYWLDYYKGKDVLFNKATDAIAPNKDNKWTEERRVKQRGWKHTPEARAKISAAGKGAIFSQERRDKIGLGHRGNKLSEKLKQYLREINTGKKASEETKNKLRNNYFNMENNPLIRANLERRKQISVDGVIYSCAVDVAKVFNTNKYTVRSRIASKNYPTWFYV